MGIKELHGKAALLEVCSWTILIKTVVSVTVKLVLSRSQVLLTWIRLRNLMCGYGFKITGEFIGV